MLQSIMRPKPFPQYQGSFEAALNEWEHLVQRCEILASDLLDDAINRQILLDMAPPGIRIQPTLAGHQSYELLRSAIMSYLIACRDWNATSRTRSPTGASPVPKEVHALTPLLRKSKDGKGPGKKGSSKSPRKPADGKTCYVCGKTGHYAMDCWQRQGQAEGSSDGKGKGKAQGKNGGKGEGKVNNITDEPPDSEQPVDPGIVGSVTLEDRIVVLAREAPPADLNPNSGFDVHADTLRTASGHALTLYGHCALKMQVPPIAGTARVTFEVLHVRWPILSVAMLVTNGHRVLFQSEDAVLSTAG